ncbi:serine/threonine-protein kinase [Lentzea sp. CC55]|uniref:serine/threonine-protein kinase n=1 Tax=Lentzea sp. CC55 TaxID=2884909 RepID=UPI001F3D7425|nr:serine/threonine-protein kinase [Lentzea sp. CC55]MCG8926368.1 protein kinase [Lentzea sp. CC55]
MPDTLLLANRYQVGALLGAGGMAEVRRGRDTVLVRDVAIKLFQPGEDLADAQRIDNEIRTLASLSHPGLVAVYDADPGGERPYMVLELVEGRTLHARIAEGPMPVEDVRRLGAAVADALAHVHERGIIHRDVKPSNVLLGDEDAPRLADFGLARLADSARLTRADQVVGTAAYLSPEQVRGDAITPAVDVYALGLVLLECLTGRREFQGGEVEAAVARLHRSPEVPADLPFDLRRLLTLMTSTTPARRPSARECARALTAQGPVTVAAPLPRRSRGAFVAAAVVLAASVGTGLLLQGGPAVPAESAPPATTEPASTQVRTVQWTPAPAPVAHTEAEVQAPPPAQQQVWAEPGAAKQKPGKAGPGEGKGKKGP